MPPHALVNRKGCTKYERDNVIAREPGMSPVILQSLYVTCVSLCERMEFTVYLFTHDRVR